MANSTNTIIPQDPISLPAPKREEYGTETRAILTGEQVIGPVVQARLPLIDQELIDSGNVYLEYGRLRGLSKSRERIVFWADGTGAYDGTTTGGGTHSNIAPVRPNRIPVTQSRDLMFVLPRELFYKTRNTQYFDELNPTGISVYDELVCSGSRSRNIKDPSSFDRKPLLQNFKDRYHTVQPRYARLIVIEDGNVIAQGDISEPYFTETEKMVTISTDTMTNTLDASNPNPRERRINGRIGESHKH